MGDLPAFWDGSCCLWTIQLKLFLLIYFQASYCLTSCLTWGASLFAGDNRCFLFSVFPTLAVYTYTGYNDHYMYLNHGQQTMPNGLVSIQKWWFGNWICGWCLEMFCGVFLSESRFISLVILWGSLHAWSSTKNDLCNWGFFLWLLSLPHQLLWNYGGESPAEWECRHCKQLLLLCDDSGRSSCYSSSQMSSPDAEEFLQSYNTPPVLGMLCSFGALCAHNFGNCSRLELTCLEKVNNINTWLVSVDTFLSGKEAANPSTAIPFEMGLLINKRQEFNF